MTSVCSVVQPDVIKVIAEMCGVAKMKNDVALLLAGHLEHRLKFIVEDAAKYMKHSKRNTLSTEDIDYSLRSAHFEVGFKPISILISQYSHSMVIPPIQTQFHS